MNLLVIILLGIILLCAWGLVPLLASYFNEEIYLQTHREYVSYKPQIRYIHFIFLILEGPFVFLRLLKKKK